MDPNTQTNQQSYDFSNSDLQEGSGRKKILSLVIGLVVITILFLIFFVFLLPKLLPSKPKEVSLTYWGIWKEESVMKDIISEFSKDHPNIKIKYEKQDIKSLGKYVERLMTRTKNGGGPDILRYHASWLPELKDYIFPLPESVVKEAGLESNYFPVVSQDLKINGAYYGIPIHFDTLALFINTKLFTSAGVDSYPTNWDDFIKVAAALTVPDSENKKILTSGAALGTYDNISHASDIISLLLTQSGADLKNLAGGNREKTESAIEYYTEFARGEKKIWDETLDNSKLSFAKGSLAMYFGYSWDIFEIKDPRFNLEFAVVPVPHLTGSNNTIASYWVEGVSSGSKHPKEAFEFLKFLSKRETLEKMYAKESKLRLFGELSPRLDMASLYESNPLLKPFISQGKEAFSTPFSSDTHDEAMVDSLNIYLGNAIRSIVSDNYSTDTAIENLEKGLQQVFERYGK